MKYKVGKYYLDKEQSLIVEDESKQLLVVAGAGSGKTLTILGKLKYLINKKNIDPKEIICISFTAAASNDLRRKIKEDINLDINVYTFHKLGLQILKKKNNYDIAEANLLEDMIDVFFREEIFKDKDSLKVVLKYFNLKNENSYRKFYDMHYAEIQNLKRLLSTFIRLFKANANKLENFLKFLDRAKLTFSVKKYKREKLLLTLAVNIYTQYQNYLEENAEIDFDDMLIKAKKTVDKFGYFHRVKYIIIDEYQDTSLVRFNLVKSILDKTGASLIAVGDDFQSIYRFTGCDLTLFLNFKKIFPDGKILKIQNTYRNSLELISCAGDFVMKNKKQMKKKLKSSKRLQKPIVIYKYTDEKRSFLSLIKKIYNETHKAILVLGRNNFDIKQYIDDKLFTIDNDQIIYNENKSIKMRYLTAHKSKGLEEENVIIINLKNSILGFPNQMDDDKILRFVSPTASKFPFDEERRLFYVALTRTKNKVYLLVPKFKESPFVKELEENYKNKIDYI